MSKKELNENDHINSAVPNAELQTIIDLKNNIPYLIETGAEVSVIPRSMISSFEENKAAPKIGDIGWNKTKSLGCTELGLFVGLEPDLPHQFYVF